jgi:hypothetical protein
MERQFDCTEGGGENQELAVVVRAVLGVSTVETRSVELKDITSLDDAEETVTRL